MDIADALQMVLELAKGERPTDPYDEDQKEAIDLVEDMAVNQFGDDFDRSPKIKVSAKTFDNAISAGIFGAITEVIYMNGGNPNTEEIEELVGDADGISARFFEIEPPKE